MEDLISVIVPIYNVEKYLEKCLKSIINQTYKKLEIILIDDGSTDNSGKICDNYISLDKRIVVVHKKNGGLSDARNVGINMSSGKYITFVDSDDFIDQRMYEILYKNIKNTNSDISICKYYKFEQEEEIVEYTMKEKLTIYEKDDILNHMYDDYLNTIVAWNKLYKKTIFKNIQYPKGEILEDAAIIHYILNIADKVVYSNLELYFYRQRENSIMATLNINEIVELDYIYNRIQFLKDENKTQMLVYKLTLKKYLLRFRDLYFKLHKSRYFNPKIYRKYISYANEILKEFKIENKDDFKLKTLVKLREIYLVLKLIKKINIKIIYFIKENKRKFEIIKFDINYKKYIKNCNKENIKKHIIFNAPNHGNIGDYAILFAEQKILNDHRQKNIYIYSYLTDYFIKKYKKTVKDNDVIYITGGGNLGTLWENEQDRVNKILKIFSNNEIIIFPQTIYYGDDRHSNYRLIKDKSIYQKCKNIKIACRDFNSYLFCKENLKIYAINTPDIVTYLNFSNTSIERKNKFLYCFRNDKEKTNSQEENTKIINRLKLISNNVVQFTTVYNDEYYNYNLAKKNFNKILKNIKSSKLVVTDRLHAMIFSVITGTPCIAFANKSGKVKGVYDWIKKENNYIFFANSLEEFNKILNNIILKNYTYKNEDLKLALNKILLEEKNRNGQD